jgi:GT2 family glycosyltransferase
VRTPTQTTLDAEQPAGAMLMVRRTAWETIGGFDEGFHPVWFEDVDFCRRLRDAGYKIAFEPAAVAQHLGGHSAGKLVWKSREVYWYGSLLRYASKHFTTPSRALVAVAVAGACIPRMVIRSVLYRSLAPISVYSKVMWLSGLCLMSSRTSGGLGAPQGLAVEPGTE